MERHVYGVSELNGLIKAVLDSIPQLGNVCVRGEISNYKYYPSSGHHYFSSRVRPGISGSVRRTGCRCWLWAG